MTAIPATGWPLWSSTAAATLAKPGRHLAVLGRVAALPGLGEQRPQRRSGWPARAVPVHERRPVGVERAHLGRRQRRQDRPAAGGQVGGQPDPDVGDQRRAARARAPPRRTARHGRAAPRGGRSARCGRPARRAAGGRSAAAAPAGSSRCRPRRPRPRARKRCSSARWATKPSSIIALIRWYAVLRGSSQARMIASSGTGSGWLARYRSTRRARVAAGTWLTPGDASGSACPPAAAGPRSRAGSRAGPAAGPAAGLAAGRRASCR